AAVPAVALEARPGVEGELAMRAQPLNPVGLLLHHVEVSSPIQRHAEGVLHPGAARDHHHAPRGRGHGRKVMRAGREADTEHEQAADPEAHGGLPYLSATNLA